MISAGFASAIVSAGFRSAIARAGFILIQTYKIKYIYIYMYIYIYIYIGSLLHRLMVWQLQECEYQFSKLARQHFADQTKCWRLSEVVLVSFPWFRCSGSYPASCLYEKCHRILPKAPYLVANAAHELALEHLWFQRVTGDPWGPHWCDTCEVLDTLQRWMLQNWHFYFSCLLR